MCSRNIEDIVTPAFLKQDLIDPNKMKLFMEKFIDESKDLTNNRSIDKTNVGIIQIRPIEVEKIKLGILIKPETKKLKLKSSTIPLVVELFERLKRTK